MSLGNLFLIRISDRHLNLNPGHIVWLVLSTPVFITKIWHCRDDCVHAVAVYNRIVRRVCGFIYNFSWWSSLMSVRVMCGITFICLYTI